jgi:hypothetical protein
MAKSVKTIVAFSFLCVIAGWNPVNAQHIVYNAGSAIMTVPAKNGVSLKSAVYKSLTSRLSVEGAVGVDHVSRMGGEYIDRDHRTHFVVTAVPTFKLAAYGTRGLEIGVGVATRRVWEREVWFVRDFVSFNSEGEVVRRKLIEEKSRSRGGWDRGVVAALHADLFSLNALSFGVYSRFVLYDEGSNIVEGGVSLSIPIGGN